MKQLTRVVTDELRDKFGIIIPAPTEEELEELRKNREHFQTLEDANTAYANDKKGGMARAVEVGARYYVTGVIERAHPAGVTDCVVKGGVTLEVKSGHGWVIEPQFLTREGLQDYIEERTNPLFGASHIAYLPARATCAQDAEKCRVMTARKFISLFADDDHQLLQYKCCRGYWGVAMKEWISEGYKRCPSKKKEARYQKDILENSESLQEFTERMGLTYYGNK